MQTATVKMEVEPVFDLSFYDEKNCAFSFNNAISTKMSKAQLIPFVQRLPKTSGEVNVYETGTSTNDSLRNSIHIRVGKRLKHTPCSEEEASEARQVFTSAYSDIDDMVLLSTEEHFVIQPTRVKDENIPLIRSQIKEKKIFDRLLQSADLYLGYADPIYTDLVFLDKKNSEETILDYSKPKLVLGGYYHSSAMKIE